MVTGKSRLAGGLGCLALLTLAAWGQPQPQPANPQAPERIVYLLPGNVLPADLTTITANLVASGRDAPFLIDTAKAGPWNRKFIADYQATRIQPLGQFADDLPALQKRYGPQVAAPVSWKHGPPADWFTRAERVIVCSAEPRGELLQAAAYAAAGHWPLLVEGKVPLSVAPLLSAWQTQEMVCVGLASPRAPVGVRKLRRHDPAAAHRRLLKRSGPIAAVVLANPADGRDGAPALSALAPWVAQSRHAALLLTNDDGKNAADLLQTAAGDPELHRTDAVLIVATQQAIPVEKRPNPIAGKDELIEMEPGTPADLAEPFTFATGRLFHDDIGLVALQLARPRLWPDVPGKSTVLLASNPGGGLPLLETFSRNTAKEFRNRGYRTAAFFEDEVTRDEVQKRLPGADIFLWEGHHQTLVRDFESVKWTEPLRPGLVFLQSCLALNEPEALPLLQRGAVATVGSSTRTYSGSGGSFTLAFFDAMLYDGQTLGGSLRQAKNFLACYSLLKDKRLGAAAKLKGANLRSAWAFTLWGDSTLLLPRPPVPDDALPHVRAEVVRNTIVLKLPATSYEPVKRRPFVARMMPNARLAGLIAPEGVDEKRLVPFLFAEVALPKAPANKKPILKSALPSNRYVFTWDARRKVGYLLTMPRAKDQMEIRFAVHWEE